AGYNSGAWTAASASGVITSSAAAANHASGANNTGIGFIDSSITSSPNTTPNTIELAYAQLGDTNLDGTVDFNDLGQMLKSYGHAGTWVNGDTNYDGQVDFNDLGALLKNYGHSLAPTQSAPPAAVGAASTTTVLAAVDATPADSVVSVSSTTDQRKSGTLTPIVNTK